MNAGGTFLQNSMTASAFSLKCEGRDLGLIMDLTLLSMELSGNLIQYESGSDAGQSMEHILCNNGTHWKPCPLESSNI